MKFESVVRKKENKNGVYDDAFVRADALGLYILADGLGAHPQPAKASRIAAFNTALNLNDFLLQSQTSQASDDEVRQQLYDAVREANETLYDLSTHRDSYYRDTDGRRSASTLDVCLFINDKLFYVHLGDASVFMMDRSGKTVLLPDEKPLSECMENSTQIMLNNNMHGGTGRVLGCERDIDFPIYDFPFAPSSNQNRDKIVFMTTDGITKLLHPQAIDKFARSTKFNNFPDAILNEASNPVSFAQQYADHHDISLDQALERLVGSDAITAIAIGEYKRK